MDLSRIFLTDPWLFPVFFILMWLLVTTLLSGLSGWYGLMRDYPDRDEATLLRIGGQSGMMGVPVLFLAVSMGRILRIDVCPSGLRFGMMRIFGPFLRDFFVPWPDLAIQRRTLLFWPRVDFRFGGRVFPTLTISGDLAERLAAAAPPDWPETELPAPQTDGQIVLTYLVQWLAVTAFAAAFFNLAPRLMGAPAGGPPFAVTVLLPGIVFGVFTLIQLLRRLMR